MGVTGGIAVGKSTVVAELARLGAVVICADHLAREVVAPGASLIPRLVEAFGAEVLHADGTLNRPWLAEQVFGDPEKRDVLNGLMHPAIHRKAVVRLQDALTSGAPLVVYDAPLLFEAGADSVVDKVLVVTAEEAIQLARLMARDGLTEEEARARIAAQWSQWKKAERADFRIDNSGALEKTLAEVGILFEKLRARSI